MTKIMDPVELLHELVEKSLSGYVYDMASVVHYVYRDKYVCAKLKGRQWFYFDGLKWCYTEIGPYHDISTKLVKMYEVDLDKELAKGDVFMQLSSAVNDASDNPLTRAQLNEWDLSKKRMLRLELVIAKLKNVTFKEAVCREAMYLFYNSDFLNKLDKERHLICFKNGVLDLRSKQFRSGNREDYLSLYVDDEYMTPATAGDVNSQHKITKFMSFRENVIVKRKGSQFKFTIGSED